MAWIFTPRANTVARVVAAGLLTTPALGALGLWAYARSPLAQNLRQPVPQPVQFDHRHHAGDEAIDCRYCHSTVEVSSSAGYPSQATCLGCHAQVWNQSPLLEPVRQAYFSDRPIPWSRVHDLPDFVYFNHAIHVNKGVGCVTCHGRVDLMPSIQQAQPLSMGWCLDCHRDPAPNLRPLDTITSMRWRPGPGDPGPEELARRYDVQPRTNCTACHR
ncbi:cytochrome C [Archangium sp. Cb G35]|uniref:cytochrome c3 family protein n=1 Tax=Archangium sp. Cb G35 TaxID=1920190 RepID=UPI000936052F|nr:cytochrome c3 family protein [Archangium sp. Cb G35]OJT17422.1 cytochrome C [Archangium sp. Cb G35]